MRRPGLRWGLLVQQTTPCMTVTVTVAKGMGMVAMTAAALPMGKTKPWTRARMDGPSMAVLLIAPGRVETTGHHHHHQQHPGIQMATAVPAMAMASMIGLVVVGFRMAHGSIRARTRARAHDRGTAITLIDN